MNFVLIPLLTASEKLHKHNSKAINKFFGIKAKKKKVRSKNIDPSIYEKYKDWKPKKSYYQLLKEKEERQEYNLEDMRLM